MAQLAAPDGGGLEWTQNPHTLWGGEARLTGGGGGWGGVGSEDEERSLRRDERRAGRGLITPLSPYSSPSPWGS